MPTWESDLNSDDDHYMIDSNMKDDAESAILAMKKVIQGTEFVDEITKIWAWAYTNDDESAIMMGDKMGLNIRNVYAVLDWKEDYKKELYEYFDDISVDGDYD